MTKGMKEKDIYRFFFSYFGSHLGFSKNLLVCDKASLDISN